MGLYSEVYDSFQDVKIPIENIDSLEMSLPPYCYVTFWPYAADVKDLDA